MKLYLICNWGADVHDAVGNYHEGYKTLKEAQGDADEDQEILELDISRVKRYRKDGWSEVTSTKKGK